MGLARPGDAWAKEYDAPVGVYVCGACGRTGKNRAMMGDEACFLNAVECWPSSIVKNERGKVTHAVACEEEWVEPCSATAQEGEPKKP
jgi:hypothetical protein